MCRWLPYLVWILNGSTVQDPAANSANRCLAVRMSRLQMISEIAMEWVSPGVFLQLRYLDQRLLSIESSLSPMFADVPSAIAASGSFSSCFGLEPLLQER
jgi:hypothetical protein